MADPKGFLKVQERELPARRPVPVRLMDGKRSTSSRSPARSSGRPDAAWTAASRSATRGARSATSSPSGTTSPGAARADRRSSGCTRRTTSRSSRVGSAGTVRGVLRARHQPAPGDDQAGRGLDHRRGVPERLGHPHPPERLTGKTVAVVGSGPAGLAAAQQLTRAGHTVAVYDVTTDRRSAPLRHPGLQDGEAPDRHAPRPDAGRGHPFRAGVEIGRDITWDDLKSRYDAVVVATGATVPRDLPIPGRDLAGVHFAMDYLVQQNKATNAGTTVDNQVTAEGKHVVVIGVWRHRSRLHRHRAPTGRAERDEPGDRRAAAAGASVRPAVAMFPTVFEVTSAHEEGGERHYLASTVEFLANEAARSGRTASRRDRVPDGRRVPKSGTEREIPADLVLVAMGFTGPETDTLEPQLGLPVTVSGAVRARPTTPRTSRASSSPVTPPWAVAHRVGDRRGAAPPPRRWTSTSRARRSCRPPSRPPTVPSPSDVGAHVMLTHS